MCAQVAFPDVSPEPSIVANSAEDHRDQQIPFPQLRALHPPPNNTKGCVVARQPRPPRSYYCPPRNLCSLWTQPEQRPLLRTQAYFHVRSSSDPRLLITLQRTSKGPTHAKTYSSSSPLLMPPLQRRPCLRLQFRGSDETRPYLIGDWSGPLLGQILPFLKFISLRLRCTLTKIACYIN